MSEHNEDAEQQHLAKKGTENLDAYNEFLQGREHFRKFTKDNNREAEERFARAIELDPNYAAAYVELSRVLVQRRNYGWSETPNETLENGLNMARKAVELDDTDAEGYFIKGFVHLWRHEHDLALADLETGLALDPNHADGHMRKAIVCGFSGQPERGMRALQHATRLNPESPFWYLFAHGNASFAMERNNECVEACRKSIVKNPNFMLAQMLLAAVLGQLGQFEEAGKALGECRRLNPRFSLEWAQNLIHYKEKATRDRFSAGLKMAGLTN